jgi:hypothetical protein
MRFPVIISLVLFGLKLHSQGDSIAYSRDFTLYEGLYLGYWDLRHNWPIPKEKIVTTINKDQLDFYSKLIEDDNIEYIERDGNKTRIKAEKVWGFCENNVIYINIGKSFFRITVFGAICYFPASVEINSLSPGYNVFINGPVGTTNTGAREIREFLMDFYTGSRVDFSLENLENMLKKDEEIYKQFMDLSKKKRKDQATLYIRKYNEKHPVYFPKN